MTDTPETVEKPDYARLELVIRNAVLLVGDAASDAENPDVWNRGGAGYDAHLLLLNTKRALDGEPPLPYGADDEAGWDADADGDDEDDAEGDTW
jgi:hypothetical protein